MAAPIRLLIVEDSVIEQRSITEALQAVGIEVVGAVNSGEKAVAAFRILKPDVVSMDLNIPGMGGIEAIRHLKKEDPRARIIVLSGLDDKATIFEAISAGAQRYVAKPFQAAKMLGAIESITGSADKQPATSMPRLGDLLVEKGVISEAQLDKALAMQAEQGGFLGDNMVQLNFISKEIVARYVFEQSTSLLDAMDDE